MNLQIVTVDILFYNKDLYYIQNGLFSVNLT